ncbi:MAG: methyltransferase domain-containing protein [Lachnospiraceae bacterium]|nr:methyltransferase domain-containing protein [Lachnospiraceae bacterium]
MEKAIIYGIGNKASENLGEIENKYNIMAVSDSNSEKWGNVWYGYPVIEPAEINNYAYDWILVPSFSFYHQIFQELTSTYHIDAEKIRKSWNKGRAELDYWKTKISEELTLKNDHYKEILLCMAERENDSFMHGKVIADFGCGPRGSLAWTNSPAAKIGIDVLALEYVKAANTHNHGMIYLTSTETDIPISNNTVDYMFTLNAFDRVSNPERMICEIARVLKDSGEFIASFDLHQPEEEGQPQWYTEQIIDNLLKDKFCIISRRLAYSTGWAEPYKNMLDEKYETKINPDRQGYLWIRAKKIKKLCSTEEII